MMKIKLFVCVVAAVLAVLPLSVHAQSVPVPAYIFAEASSSERNLRIVQLDPSTGLISLLSELSPNDFKIDFSTLRVQSPSNNQIVTILAKRLSDNTLSLQLLDAVQGKVIFESNNVTVNAANSSTGDNQAVEVSPDRKYLVYNDVDSYTGFGVKQVKLDANYAVSSVIAGASTASNISWSADSNYFIIAQTMCNAARFCKDILTRIRADFSSPKISVNINDVVIPLPDYGRSICSLSLSPKGDYATFVMGCDYTIGDASKDLYLWDIRTGRVIAITDDSTKMQKRGEFNLVGRYNIVWLADDVFFYSKNVFGSKSAVAGSYIYNIASSATTKVSDSFIDQISLRPDSKFIAYKTVLAGSWQGTVVGGVELKNLDLVQSLPLTVSNNLSTTSDVQWSLDGQFLSIVMSNQDETSIAVQFFTAGTEGNQQSLSSTYNVAASDGRILPIGWIEIEK